MFRALKAAVSVVVMMLVVGAACAGGVALATDDDTVHINVDQDDLLDVVMTLGQTDSDVSTVQSDLTAALVAKGVPSDKIRITAVEASEVSAGNTSSGWKIYDHYGNWGEDPYPSPDTAYSGKNHIIVKNSGQQISFYGYGSPAYVDFMYMPNSDSTEKTFTFTMDDANINSHSMLGAGFLFNTNITSLGSYATQTVSGHSIVTDTALNNQYMTGYLIMMYKSGSGSYPILYKVSDKSLKSFHDSGSNVMSAYGSTTGVTLLQSYSSNVLSGTHSITVKVSGTTLTMSDTVGSTTKSLTYTGITDTGSYGFGPVSIYNSHGCNMLSWFNFQNLHMETTSAKHFSEVIREPEWRPESKRFIINAQDTAVADFSDPVALGEILARLGNENIHYIGWGRDDSDGNAFIAKNDGRGVFVDKDVTTAYANQISAMAAYIYEQYVDSVHNDVEYLIYGKPSSLSITPESEQTNTADENWPNGKWYVDQDEDYYDNPTGVVPYDELYLNNLDISFTETGRYEIYYKDALLKTVYVHRKPVAGFSLSVGGDRSVTITDTAYDPDYESESDKGIKSEVWQYKETTASDWTNGQPANFEADKNYVVRQVVTDNYDVSSDPYYRYVSTESGATSPPVAEFKVTPSRLLTYATDPDVVSYEDTSYDPQGSTITARLWTVSLDGTEVYSGSTAKTDFTGSSGGTYKITLKVQNASGEWSEEVARYLTVVVDSTAPTAACDTTGGSTYNQPKVVGLTFDDETGGSGFSHRYAVVTATASTPAEWGSMGTNDTYSVSITRLGANYIHYRAYDYAGNERIGYFGPFTIVDNSAPSAPDVTFSPSYVAGSWANESITLTAGGATDNFTAAADIAYSVSANGTDFSAGDSITLGSDGVHTVTFKVADGSGNSTTTSRTVKTDKTAPSAPSISMTSGGDSYESGTWSTANVSIALADATDGSSGLAGYQYKVGDGSWQSGDSYTFNTSGVHTFYYRSVDNAGNHSETQSVTVKVDLEAPGEPTIEVSPACSTEWTSETTTLTASLSTDDVTEPQDLVYSVSTNGTDFSEGNSITLSSEGSHTVTFKVTDSSGHSTTASKTVKIDKTAPSVPEASMTSGGAPYSQGTWATDSVAVVIHDSDDTGGSGLDKYQYKIGDGSWQDGTAHTFDASGEYTLRYRSMDGAGNVSETATKSIMVDLEAPEPFSISTSVTAIDSIAVSAYTTDALSGMAAAAYRISDGNGWSGWKATLDETLGGYSRGQEVTITVEARDAAGNVRSSSVTVSTLDNTTPVAKDDAFSVKEDVSAALDVLANDTDADTGRADGDSLSVKSASALSKTGAGSLSVSDGRVNYTPADDWNGKTTFTYTVVDRHGATDTGQVTLTVTPVNDPCTACDDSVSTDEDTPVDFEVLSNDTDVDSTPYIRSINNPQHGRVSRSGTGIEYAPAKDFSGSDSFTYTITDGQYDSTATVSVTVRAVNDAPEAYDDRAGTCYMQPVSIDVLANDTDVDADSLSVSEVTSPGYGTAEISDGKVVYTPKHGFTGTDTFSYSASDGKASATAEVTVEVSYPEHDEDTTVVVPPPDGGSDSPVKVTTKPANGTVEVVGDTTIYTAGEGAAGLDSYNVATGNGEEYRVLTYTDPATGETTIIGSGIPLSAGYFEVRGAEIRIALKDYINDFVEGSSVTVVGQPVHGQVTVVDGVLIYRPTIGYLGHDGTVVSISIGGKQVPYSVAFNVVKDHGQFFSWWCVLGWVVMALLLSFVYALQRRYYTRKWHRTVAYAACAVAAMLLLCWLRSSIGYPVPIALAIVYVIAAYVVGMWLGRSARNRGDATPGTMS